MDTKPSKYTVAQIRDLQGKGFFKVNPEYQRGLVWATWQKQLLIDSILRGYPLPKLYMHRVSYSQDELGLSSQHLEIIDGQQRINAIVGFSQDEFPLLNPRVDRARFPQFHREKECTWAGRTYTSLDTVDRLRLDNFSLAVEEITSESVNEARDLFIRLQAGTSLTAQEKRDALPGRFGEFIGQVAGRGDGGGGVRFFEHAAVKPRKGKRRQLAAQICAVLLARCRGLGRLPGIRSKEIDDLYHLELDFDLDSAEAKDIRSILDAAHDIMSRANMPPLKQHLAIHIALVVQALEGEYAPGWRQQLPEILAEFDKQVVSASKTRSGGIWDHYVQLTRTGADRAESLESRDWFIMCFVLQRLSGVGLKDAQRGFTDAERRIVFYRDSRTCKHCGHTIEWQQAEIDHVKPHVAGGPTTLDNAQLLCSSCHSAK